MSDKIQELESQLTAAVTQEEKVDALNALAAELSTTDHRQALVKSEEAAKLARAVNFKAGLAQSLKQMCQANTRLGHYDLAFTQRIEAQALFQELEDNKGLTRINLLASEIYHFMGDYAMTAELATDAYHLALTLDDTESESNALMYMGIAYSRIGDYEQGLLHFEKALAICHDAGNKPCEATILNNIAMLKQDTGEYQDALPLAFDSLKLDRELGNKTLELTILDTISRIYVGLEEPEKALEYAQESLRLSQELGMLQEQVWSLLNIGGVQYRRQDVQALEYAIRAQALAQQINAKRELSDSHKLLAEIYKDQGRFEEAFEHHKQFHILHEEIFNTENSKRLQLLKVQQQIDIAQREADILEQKNVELEQEIAERKQAEKALRKAQARAQLILESVTLPLLVSRIKDGEVLYANDRVAEMVGLVLEDVLGNQTPDFYRHPEDRVAVLNAIREHGGIDNKELALKRADGTPFWALMSNRLIDFEDEPAIITTLIDITDRKQAQVTIAKRAAELQTVAELSAAVTATRDTAQLLQNVVDLMQSKFDLYHAHVCLLNDGHDTLILAAGSGEIGRRMVAEGFAIPLHHKRALMVQAVHTVQGVIENDAQANSDFYAYPMLPKTRSEMAVPMMIGDQVIGALAVQATEVGRFTTQDVAIQTTLATQIAVALENTRSFERAQKAVANLNEVTRRLTRKGWQEYLVDLPNEASGFVYDVSQLDSVRPINRVEDERTSDKVANNGAGVAAAPQITQAITVHGEMIGQLAVIPDETDEQADPEMMEIITAVTEQLSARIENLRLTEQSQTALAETELLYQASAELNMAYTYQEVLDTLCQHTFLGRNAQNISLNYFDRPWTNEQTPEWIEILARISELPDDIARNRYLLSQFPSAEVFIHSDKPVAIEDIMNDPRADNNARALYVERAGAKSVIFVPLLVGDQQIGYISALYQQPTTFPEEEQRQVMVLARQAAVAVQSIRLLADTRQRAQREQLKREIAEKVRGAVDVETIMRTAVTEVGRALGRRTFIYLEDQPETSEE